MKENDELLRLTGSLGFILINTSMQIKDEVRKGFVAAGFDITPDQFAVLIRLWSEDGLSQRELCGRTLKTKSNITRILDSMEKKGLVKRQVNKEDRRSFNIYLTDTGKKLREKLVPLANKMNTQIFKNITGSDRKDLLRIVSVISKNLGQLS